MALIIEDGSVVADANSFVTDAELTAYALSRLATLPATEAERNALLILAMDFIFSKEDIMKGCRVSADQDLPYPRQYVCFNGFEISKTTIPSLLKQAQMEAAIASNTVSLLPTESTQNVQSTKVDVLEISYFSGGSISSVNLQAVDAKLKPLLKATGTMERV